MDERAIKVVLIDDHPIFLNGMRELLEEADGIDLVGDASLGAEAVALVKAHAPDVVIIDLDLPDISGVEAIRQIHDAGLVTNIVVLSAFADPGQVTDAFDAGVIAFLPKTQAGEFLVESVRRAAKGEGDIPQTFIGPMLKTIRDQRERRQKSVLIREHLTRTELQVLRLLADGNSVEQVASRSQVSVNTVRGHVRNILSKLGVHSIGQAIAIAYQSGEMEWPR